MRSVLVQMPWHMLVVVTHPREIIGIITLVCLTLLKNDSFTLILDTAR